jgi:putative tryptophan/tyrosine transport system substrate-binding protein
MHFHQWNRREFTSLLGGAAAWPLAARATAGHAGDRVSPLGVSRFPRLIVSPPFRRGLNETGYFEGRNVAVEYRWAEGRYDRFSSWRRNWFAVR